MKAKTLLTAAVAALFLHISFATDIATGADFASAIAADPSGSYTLTANITLTGWAPCDFSGTLDGAGHKIAGLDGNLFLGLSGTVRNLTLDGKVADANTTVNLAGKADFGLLALTNTATTVENCTITGFDLRNNQTDQKIYNCIGFFTARAFDGCVFSGCTVDGSCSLEVGKDVFSGGIAGRADRTANFQGTELVLFTNCVNGATCTARQSTSSNGNGAFGGIAGMIGAGTTAASATIVNCRNDGDFVIPANAIGSQTFGGMVGRLDGVANCAHTLYIVGCENNGDYSNKIGLSNNASAGGMIGYAGRYPGPIYIDRSVNNGDMIATGSTSNNGGCFGGFIGRIYDLYRNQTLTVINSINRGSVSALSTGGKSCSGGGAVGFSSTNANYPGIRVNIRNCSFEGTISANNAGQIIALGSALNASAVFNVDNCWFAVDEDRLNNVDYVPSCAESNLQFYSDEDGGNDAAACAALNAVVTAETVYDYAAWQVNAKTTHPEPFLGATLYVVSFVDWDDTVIDQQQVAEGGAATAPDDPVRTGYSFAGWDPADFSSVTSNMIVTATYEQLANFHTVTFTDWNGVMIASVGVEDGATVSAPANDPTRTGHTFVCWTLDDAQYDFLTPVTDDLELVASYAIDTFAVTFLDWNDEQIGETQMVEYMDDAVEPELPALPQGKLFWKWSGSFKSVTAPLVITAILADAETHISDAAGFVAAIRADAPAAARYFLDDDIVLSDWTSVDFSASLDGQWHTVSGLTVPLFNTLEGATVENLTIADSAVASTAQSGIVGLVARELKTGSRLSRVMTASDCTVGSGTGALAGGLVGKVTNSSSFDGDAGVWLVDCTNAAAVVKTAGDNNTAGGTAGLVGEMNVVVNGDGVTTNGLLRCVNLGSVTSAHASCKLGGFIGRANISPSADKTLLAVIDCANEGDVLCTSEGASTVYVQPKCASVLAHIVQQCGSILIERTVNRGSIGAGFAPDGASFTNKYAGGFVAYIDCFNRECGLRISNCANYGDVEGEIAGGFISNFGANANYLNTFLHLENSANYGSVTGASAAAQIVARIVTPKVAYVRDVENCFFALDSLEDTPLVYGDPDGEWATLTGIVTTLDADYTADDAKTALDSAAREHGDDWIRWRLALFNDTSVPQLRCFSDVWTATLMLFR